MDPDALLSLFELTDGMELKLLVKMSKITNKIAVDNGAMAAAMPAQQMNSALMGLKELAGRLREAGSEDEDEDDDDGASTSGDSDTYSKDVCVPHVSFDRFLTGCVGRGGDPSCCDSASGRHAQATARGAKVTGTDTTVYRRISFFTLFLHMS